ncbi:methyl-accepting chemotaxis protein [Gracilibacillus halophilus YIM-C55.5]|uniref:Methyl-accepting chemotaxis protein n=1 Tax=Gracilibacillus halophilus YIM-C55.5 TaxID=1308866 RepID=N4WU59_9BACI|nr:methyl-accepting chemotaxis protein [Gracilibacillus halophilus]ENH97900.1 methyl-accepting chemotaxis protein [Gracilibacillus halophilus YIM-C55.5]
MKKLKLRSRSVKTKLVTVTFLLLMVPLVLLGYLTYQQSKDSLNELGKTNLKNSVVMTLEMIDSLNEEVEQGNLELKEAQEQVKEALLGERQNDGTRPINTSIDLGKNGYAYISDQEGLLLAHPNMEGESLWEETDSSGNYFAQEYTEKAMNGGGYTYYDWPLPHNENRVEEKVIYSAYDENWGWVVSASTYLMDFNQPANHIRYMVFIVTSIFIIIGGLITWLFANRMTKGLHHVMQRMRDLSSGKLAQEPLHVKTNDEFETLANEMNTMQNQLHEMVANIDHVSNSLQQQSTGLNKSAHEVKTSSEQVTTTMEELASGAELQANHVSTLSEKMEGFRQIVNETDTKGAEASNESNEVLNKTSDGKELMESSTEQMKKIDSIVKDAVQKVEHLDQQSQEITTLVGVIKDIAEQTNLLALNAAIEAARAGEEGKGFAVVADEVRKLAEQVSNSVTEITNIVNRIQTESSDVSASLKTGYQEVEQGSRQIETTSETFTDIRSAVTNMVEKIQTITKNMNDVSSQTSEMNESIQEIASTSEESAAGIEETSASAEESSTSMEEVSKQANQLTEISDELKQMVDQFELKKQRDDQ